MSYSHQEWTTAREVDLLSILASSNVASSTWQAQMVRPVKDSVAFHYLSRPRWARRALLCLSKPSQHRVFTSHLLWNKLPSEPLATETVHYRGVRLRGERAHNLFDTFLCGCNCISCFPVVSFRKNAKALPIKPRATLFCTTFSLSPSIFQAFSTPAPSPLLTLVGSNWSVMRGQAGSRQIPSQLTGSCIQKPLCTQDVFQCSVVS